MARRRRSGGSRDYPRTARVAELLREILGDELERIDDSRLELVSVTGVDIVPELTTAEVFYSSLGGEESDAEVLAALAEHRVRLQAAIGRQARLRRTPELHFAPDAGVRSGQRVEEILRDLDLADGPDGPDGPDGADGADGDPGAGAEADGASAEEERDGTA